MLFTRERSKEARGARRRVGKEDSQDAAAALWHRSLFFLSFGELNETRALSDARRMSGRRQRPAARHPRQPGPGDHVGTPRRMLTTEPTLPTRAFFAGR